MILAAFIINLFFSTTPTDTTIDKFYKNANTPVTIKFSSNSKYNLLVLPGYGFSDIEWCVKTQLCEKAQKKGFNLIFVEVRKSVYLKENLPQTSELLRKYPTRTWIVDSVIKPIFNQGVLDKNKKCFVLGLSTGARGAAILLLENPDIFSGAACLSGDYDPTLQKNDNLMINALGTYEKNKKAWTGDNNIVNRVKEFKKPIFIAHGKKDNIVPIAQSLLLKDKLIKENPKNIIKYDFPENGKHDYKFWNSEIDNVLEFFIKYGNN